MFTQREQQELSSLSPSLKKKLAMRIRGGESDLHVYENAAASSAKALERKGRDMLEFYGYFYQDAQMYVEAASESGDPDSLELADFITNSVLPMWTKQMKGLTKTLEWMKKNWS